MKGWIVLVSIVFWNLENCFDYSNTHSNKSDEEFSPKGARHWTKSRFETKINLIGKTFLWAGLPDIAGVCEVENAGVMRRICKSDPLRKYNYRYIHYDSPDPRGIDVGLLYNADTMEPCESRPIRVKGRNGQMLRTRDILYVRMRAKESGGIWHLFVNHHPSKYNAGSSSERRKYAMQALMHAVDSLLARGDSNIVAMGDFNDIPSADSFKECEGKLINLGAVLSSSRHQTGSIRYKGRWQLIDNFLVSDNLKGKIRMEILQPPFLLTRDKEYPGMKPLRTYSGPRWLGGVSDHLPVRIY